MQFLTGNPQKTAWAPFKTMANGYALYEMDCDLNAENAMTLLKQSIESARDMGMAIVDKNYCCVFFNQAHKSAMKRIFGMETKTGESVLNGLPSDADKAQLKDNLDRAFAGEPHFVPRSLGDACIKQREFYFCPICSGPGGIVGVSVFSCDISGRNTLTGLYNRRFFYEQAKRMDCKKNLPLSVIIGDINGLKMVNDALGQAEGDKMIIEISKILKRCIREGDILAQTGGDEFGMLLPRAGGDETAALIKKINAACREHQTNKGTYYLSISMGYATKTSKNEPLEAKIKEAEDNMVKHKLLERKSLHSVVISSIQSTMTEKDFKTEEHAERLMLLSSALGRALAVTAGQMDELLLLSALHDIGKIAVDDKILNKRGPLTGQEWEQMKKHPEVGYRIAMALPELKSIAECIRCHHERWDGAGYPQGLAGEEIPLLARILSITDSYDAMTQDRPYRKAMFREEAAKEIKKNAGGQFDPRIAGVFVEKILLNEDL